MVFLALASAFGLVLHNLSLKSVIYFQAPEKVTKLLHTVAYFEYIQQQWWKVTKYLYFVTVLKYIFTYSICTLLK